MKNLKTLLLSLIAFLAFSIGINAQVKEDRLYISIKNSGSWFDQHKAENNGFGIKNVKKRLEHSYGEKQKFEIVKSKSFVEVRIEILEVIRDE